MALEKFYKIIITFLSSYTFGDEIFFNPFTANIEIEKIGYYSNSFVSSGLISYQNDGFIYKLREPMNQQYIGFKDKLIVQDDDFKQVMMYSENYNFLLSKVLNSDIEYEQVECEDICLSSSIYDEYIRSSYITLVDDKLDQIRIIDNQNQIFLIKFSNLVYESFSISYEVPNDYQVIRND
mgnify:CR=1 FL=1